MAQTKKLAEVDMVEYTDNTSLICEQDGKIRRISAGKVLGDTILSATSTNIVTGEKITISDSLEAPLAGLNIYGKSMQKTTTGAQLFDASLMPTTSGGGATVTNNGDGSFTISGEGQITEEGFMLSAFVSGDDAKKMLKAGNIYTNGKRYIPSFYAYGVDNTGKVLFNTSSGSGSAVITNETLEALSRLRFVFYGTGGFVITPVTFFPMIWQTGDGAYEPYTGGKPSPNLEYPQEIQTSSDFVVEIKNSMEGSATPQTLNITIPEQGFYGIPVESGGNYTDSSGKQWICDEFDFKNKKFIKRVGRVSYDGTEDEQWKMNATTEDKARFYVILSNGKIESGSKCLCNRLIYGTMGKSGSCFTSNSRFYIDVEASLNTVELLRTYLSAHTLDVIYQLETPIEIDISGEEIQAFKELHTYKPNTTIMSDSEPQAGMKVEYALDMKTYVDNKFLELATQVLENA